MSNSFRRGLYQNGIGTNLVVIAVKNTYPDVNNRSVHRDRRVTDGLTRNPRQHDCAVSTRLEGHDLESDQWILFQRKDRTKKKGKTQEKGKVGIRGDSKEPG